MTTKDKVEKEEVKEELSPCCNVGLEQIGYLIVCKKCGKTIREIKTPTPNEWIEKVAMNIVYQLDDDAKLSVEFRQANNDKRIDFVKGLIQSSLTQQKEAIEKERDEKWREKIKNVKYDYPKSENQKEHERNIDIVERTVNQIKNQLLQ